MCLLLCCLVFNICECGFQRIKVVLVLLNDLQNHIMLRIIGHFAKSGSCRVIFRKLFYGYPAVGNALFLFTGGVMSLLRLPRSKLPLTFLAVPAGEDRRVECPCQTVNDFIGVGGSVCGLFLFVQMHAPLIVPPWQSRARKSKFQFLSGARARMLSALHLRLGAR